MHVWENQEYSFKQNLNAHEEAGFYLFKTCWLSLFMIEVCSTELLGCCIIYKSSGFRLLIKKNVVDK